MKVETEGLLSIGRFAFVSGLTVKALRHYDEIGLLRPAHVDGWTGYRWYRLEQARDADAIRRLRELEVPLDEIAEILGAEPAVVRERLGVHRARLEGRAAATKRILAELDRLIDGTEELMAEKTLEVELVDEPALRAAVIRERVHFDDLQTRVPAAIDRVGAWVIRRGAATGPPVSIYRLTEQEEWFDLAVGWPVGAAIEPGGPVTIEELPATRAAVHVHHGPYDRLWAVYAPLEEWIRAQGLEPDGLGCEHYVTDPDRHPDPADWRTRVVWPVV
jgi:DNA-binding transcriptional MerR regulator